MAVLIKNATNPLPLIPGKQKIALVGPLGDNKESLLGTWAGQGKLEDVVSIMEGLRSLLGDSVELIHEPGCAIVGDTDPDFGPAIAVACLTEGIAEEEKVACNRQFFKL